MSRPHQRPVGIEQTLARLRELRLRMQPARAVEHDRRRAEDRYRDEHHDARATILNPAATSTIVGSGNAEHVPAYSVVAPVPRRMRIRLVKAVPAPKMDGFDLRGLQLDHVYDVDDRVGRYLIVAGYAVALDETSESSKPSRTR